MSAAAYQATAKRRNPRRRHTPGKMNGLEARFAAYLNALALAGIVESWEFEPCKLVILPRSGPKRRAITWTPDFRVIVSPSKLQAWLIVTGRHDPCPYWWRCYIDVKGLRWEEDALLKARMAAVKHDLWQIFGVQAKGDGWEWERFAPSWKGER